MIIRIMMNTRCFFLGLFLMFASQMLGAGVTVEKISSLTRFPGLQSVAYMYKDTCKTVEGRFPGFSPFFLIYPDKPYDAERARELVEELGIDVYVHDYSGTVCVMNPGGTTKKLFNFRKPLN